MLSLRTGAILTTAALSTPAALHGFDVEVPHPQANKIVQTAGSMEIELGRAVVGKVASQIGGEDAPADKIDLDAEDTGVKIVIKPEATATPSPTALPTPTLSPQPTASSSPSPETTAPVNEISPVPTPKVIYAGDANQPCKPGELVSKVVTEKPIVALTVDDGPSPITTAAILDVFKQTETTGTFFYPATRLESEVGRQLLRRTLQEGHEVAVHSYRHYLKNPDGNAADHTKAQSIFQESVGGVPYAYRAPGLAYSDALRTAVTNAGQCFIGVSEGADTNDWKSDFESHDVALRNLKARDDAVINQLTPGDIILVHDHMQDLPEDGGRNRERRTAAEHISYLINGIKAQGFELVTVEELLKSGQRQ